MRGEEAVAQARDTAAALLCEAFPTEMERPDRWLLCRELLPHVAAHLQHSSVEHTTAATNTGRVSGGDLPAAARPTRGGHPPLRAFPHIHPDTPVTSQESPDQPKHGQCHEPQTTPSTNTTRLNRSDAPPSQTTRHPDDGVRAVDGPIARRVRAPGTLRYEVR